MCIGMVSGSYLRYYNTYSKIHLLNPLCKILSSIIFLIMVFMASNFRVIICLFLVLLYIVFISNVPLKYYIKPLLNIKVLFIILLLINMILGVSFYNCIIIISKICFIFIYFNILLFTTTTNELVFGFSSFLRPLCFFGIPVSKISKFMALSINFIPFLIFEFNRILKSCKSRGFDYNNSSFKGKILGFKSVLIPMFVSSFRKVRSVNAAMDVKHFDCERSCVKGFGWHLNDAYVILCHLVVFTFVLVKEVVL